MHTVYIMMVSTIKTTGTMQVYFKEAVQTHKIYNRKKAQSFLQQDKFLSQRIKWSVFIPLWLQNHLWAAITQDITYQLVTSTPWMKLKADTVNCGQELWWCVSCRKMTELSLRWFHGRVIQKDFLSEYPNSLSRRQRHWLFLSVSTRLLKTWLFFFVRTSEVFSHIYSICKTYPQSSGFSEAKVVLENPWM